MIDMLNKNKLLKFKDFFRDAQGNDIILNLLINFESVKIYRLNHQFSCLDLSAKEEKTAILKPDYMMINGYLASFADIFFLIDEPEPILIAIQCRLRKNSLNLKTIKNEHEKNANISSKMKEKAKKLKNDVKIVSREKEEELRKEADEYSKYCVITIFITTQWFNKELKCISKDYILIHQENFDTFFRPVFFSHIKFVMTRDLNSNLSTASQLTLRYKTINQNMRERIKKTRKRRIFRSHEEFCQEFSELKDDNEIQNDFVYYPYPQYIDLFEHSNKRTCV